MTTTRVEEHHRKIGHALACTLRETMKPADAIIVLSVAAGEIALSTSMPEDVVDFAITAIAQLIQKRGPVAKAVLDALAEMMEPSGV